ncbi:2-phospho-L-lactate transferase [Homoserinibacter sp. YIM 151385]|uniref:2-phospho-L-lactate transferase n=1 Tax=Homoserinibacter sp. YIM 151385 TaxID=2985506 RepID=UPI0022F0398A|nr:2-phospho-L-lactate transferase [Homoserinibacter sp. YIM 151385]WBU39196.1 2-phospho-L-lactate transferase [Homoserinibacter sp. YIM 151385]
MSRPLPRVVVLAGGVGGSLFVRGLREALRERHPGVSDAELAAAITVVVNTGDDLWLAGVRLMPDIDSLLYRLAGVADEERGWGRREESERVSAELGAWGVGWPWFTLGDLDLGTHLARTSWLRDGASPGEVVARLSRRWPLGATLLPMTDAEVDTQVRTAEGDLHFQEWWTRHRASLAPLGFDNPGIEDARPSAGVLEAIGAADAVLIAPSNPVVSIGPILRVPGVRAGLASASARVVGVSPVIGGAVVRGMADVCLTAIGVETRAAAVAAHYGARDAGGLLDAWLLAEEDAGESAEVAALGVRAEVRPLWMREVPLAARLAADALDVALG